ncbi:peptidase M19 [Sphingomonas panacis]|uniref:Peptidase M19 n=1 Tax=Sphingomonas panacis TaxID=1560345 RepID=A0A1B3ZCX6_9SPHN|nr:dipeptidase [Sphingomonas panacis]AOH85265.1 peptidase M19 [Sphingomonas panacis]
MSQRSSRTAAALAGAALMLGGVGVAIASAGKAAADPARAVHEKLIVLDTHFDTPANLGRPGWSIMDHHVAVTDGDQVDYPRMVEGGVDGGFFAIYTPSGPRTPEGDRAARDFGIQRAAQIREMVAKHSDVFSLALTADDAQKAVAAHKRFVFLSMENGYPFEGDLTLMRTFRALGVTMMSPVHFKNNDLADSATDAPEWHGLSPKGKEFIAEANRLGIVIDVSHASDDVLRQAIELSKAPIILSHSGMRAIHDHPRNVSDADATLVAAKGGVIQINAYSAYMVAAPAPDPARDAAMKALMAGFMRMDSMSVADKRALMAQRKAIEAKYPAPRANFAMFMAHLLHAIRLVGIDHVGISGDFDGGGGIDGLNDITDYPKVTAALLKAGYTPADIGKVWGGNALRVLREAQALADPAAVPKVLVTN